MSDATVSIDSSGVITDLIAETVSKAGDLGSEEETVEIVGACKLMDGFFLGDAICAEVQIISRKYFSFLFRTLNFCELTRLHM